MNANAAHARAAAASQPDIGPTPLPPGPPPNRTAQRAAALLRQHLQSMRAICAPLSEADTDEAWRLAKAQLRDLDNARLLRAQARRARRALRGIGE